MVSAQGVLRNPKSSVWADMVTSFVVDGLTINAANAELLNRMKSLGEIFVFGCDEPDVFFGEGWFGAGPVVTTQEYQKCCDLSLGTYQLVVSGICV